jgi:protein-L-isoaspartate(D-aspartate) O-methyltransferase
VVLTASLPIYDARFERALKLGGRLFVVLGSGTLQQANLVTRLRDQEWQRQSLFATSIEALEHAPHPEAFGF